MPGTRRKLLDVARGVASSFCSRNNDYERAWLPGVLLHRRTREVAESALTLDLLGLESNDEVTETIRATYSALLRSIAKRVGLTEDVIKAAHLSVQYRPREPNWDRREWKKPREILARPSWWFTVTVSIEDDRGRTWSATDTNWCWPDARALPVGRVHYGIDGRFEGDAVPLITEHVHQLLAAMRRRSAIIVRARPRNPRPTARHDRHL